MTRSVLDDLGEEITGIVAPVSICMALVVVLVKALNPEGITDSSTVAIATIAYHEKDTDSTGQKLGGALLNAIIFMAVIAGMTFILFLLFKWGCYKLIYGYMAFAMVNVFFFLTGALVIQLLRLVGLHMDLFSLTFLLVNFSVLGILSLFFMPVPLFLKQCYTVWVGICVAYIFTHVPEWTTWVLLVIMALYDLAAVLLPGGPLKILVELAVERQQELPALIYESRPVGRPYQRGMWRRQQQQQQQGSSAGAAAGTGSSGLQQLDVAASTGSSSMGLGAAVVAPLTGAAASGGDNSPSHRVALLAGTQYSSDELSQEMARTPGGSATAGTSPGPRRGGWSAGPLAEGREDQQLQQQQQRLGQLVGSYECQPPGCMESFGRGGAVVAAAAAAHRLVAGPLAEAKEGPAAGGGSMAGGDAGGSRAAAPLAALEDAEEVTASATGGAEGGRQQQPDGTEEEGAEEEDESEAGLPDAIKLGLGDFIFYSMLVGRAAMYDLMTVFTSYMAVIAGLVTTLLLLALARKALPALPVSIALGVLFYFLTRLVMEPVVVPMGLSLAFY